MNDSNFLRRSKAGHIGSSAPAFRLHLVALLLVGAASLLTLAGALTLPSRGPFGHGHSTTGSLPSWPESNTLVARQNHSTDARASLTVRFRPGTSPAAARRQLARFGAVETGSVEQLGLHVVSVDPAKAQALLEALRSEHAVAAATPDDVRQVTGDTSADLIAGQWALRKIGSPAAQKSAPSKRRVTVAVLDTGVDGTHPALAGHLVAGYSTFDGSQASNDPSGHGTWMASIALATDPAARVMPVQVLNAHGLGKDSDIIKGLVWAADHGANVISMSFAGVDYSPALQSAIDYAWSKGAVVVAATGNAGSSEPTYPAGDANVVGVSATDVHDRLWSGSNYGADTFLVAPGVDVVAAAHGGGTATITGTSASAALVAGSAALLLGSDLKSTNALVAGRLAASADKVGNRFSTGHGRLNLARAVATKSAKALTPAGVAGRAARGSFISPYLAAGASTTPTAVGNTICANGGTTCSATASTLVLTLSAAVPLNSTLFIVAGWNGSSATSFTATDNSTGGPNTYTVDAKINNATATTKTIDLIRVPVTHAYASGNTITITYPASSTALKTASAFYVNGLITTSPLDSTTGTGTGTSTAAAATTGSTTSANVLVVGGVANATVGAASNSCTAGTTGGLAGQLQVLPLYKSTTATGTMTCGATVAATSWAAVTAAYKVDVTSPVANVTFPTTSVNAGTWTGAITGTATDESGGSGIDTNAGKTQLSIHDDTTNQYWSGAAWSAAGGGETYFNPTTGPSAVAPGTATTWSYTFAGTNLTIGHAYTVHNTTTDLAGNLSAVDAQAFSYLGSASGPTGVGTAICANGGTTCSASASTLVLTLSAAVPLNSTLFVVAGWNGNSATSFTATDNSTGGPNTYTVDAKATNATATTKTIDLLRIPVTHAYASGNTITITYPAASTALKTASAFYMKGLITASPLDSTTGTLTGTTSPATAVTGATASGNALVVGGVANATVGAANNSCTAGTTGGLAGQLQVLPLYKSTTATGAMTCGAAVAATSWAAVTAAYKVDVTSPTAAFTFPTAAAYNTAGWTGSVTGSATDESGGSGIDTTAGKTQLSIHDDTLDEYWTGAAWGAVAGAETYFNPTTGPTAVLPGTAAPWSYTFASTNLVDGHDYTIHAKTSDLAGNASAVAAKTTTYDILAPTAATLTTNASYNAAGWSGHVDGTTTDAGTNDNGISAVNVSIADSVSGKCWNGTNFTTATCPNWVPVSSGGTAIGAANASWQYNLASAALTDGHTYTVSVQATDATTTGNVSGTLAAGTFKYDTTPPAFGTLSYLENGNCDASLFASGSTMYYRPTAAICANAFEARAVVTDATSGPASVNFPAIATGSFAHTNETVPGTSPYTSLLHYGWSATNASFSSTTTLTATDGAGNTATTNDTITLDTTAPGGGSISVPATVKTLSVPITSTSATDGGSGLAAGTNVITRSAGQAVATNACPGSGYSGSTVVTTPDTGVVSGQCYVYTLTATDNVGNVATWTTSPVMVDTVNPTDAFTLTAVSGGVFKSGATIYYKGNVAGSFKLRNTLTDGVSGPASTTFGLLTGFTGATHTAETVSTPSGGPYDSTAIGWTTASGTGSLAAHGTDVATNSQTDTTFTLTLDNSAPTGGVISVPAFVTATSVPITSTSATDGGSGLAGGTNVITRSAGQAVAANLCPVGGYSGSTVVTTPDTGVVSGQCYVYTLTATDNVGNVATWVTSPVMVDTANPADAYTLNSVSGGVFKSGTTIYYKGNAAGSFKLRNTLTDALSGPASTTFGLLTGFTGATHTAETVSTPAGGPYDSTAIGWTTASGTGSLLAHGTDAAGNSPADTSFTLTLDNTAPGGGAISVPATVNALSVAITSTPATDGGSGLAGGTNVITRSAGQAVAANLCPVGGYNGSTVVTTPDTGVVSGFCYVYTLTATDNVGNVATWTTSPVMVDTVAPGDSFTLTSVTGGASKSGSTIYYKGNTAGSFKIRDTVTDALSGPASATFGSLSGGTGFSTHNSETISTPAGGPYDSTAISWTSASGAPTMPAHGTDVAANSPSDTTFTLTLDNTAPAGGAITVPTTVKTLSVPITSTPATDGGSGLAGGTNVITRSAGQAVAANLCPIGGYSGSTVVTTPDTGVVSGQCYVYTLTATDNVGNVATWTTSPVMVDTVAPSDAFTLTAVSGGVFKSGATIYYKGDVAGSFKLRNTLTDGLSGPASTTFGLLTGFTGATHTAETVSTPSGGPYDSTAIGWTTASGTGSLAAHGTDVATNSQTDTTFTLTLDNSAPTGGSISVPTYATAASVAITSGNYSDGGSGIASNVITRSNGQSPIGGVCPAVGTFTGSTVVTSPDSGVVNGQCYVYTLTGTDNVGNAASLATTNAVLVDTTAPGEAVTLTGVSGGVFKNATTIYYKGNAAGSFKLRDTVTDAGSGPASATFGTLTGGSGFSVHNSETISGSSPYDSTAITWAGAASGAPTIPVHATDAAGTSTGNTAFTLSLDNTAPGSGSISVPAYATSTSVTITSSNYTDGGSGLAGGSNTITRSNGQAPTAGVCPGAGYSGATVVTSPDSTVANGQCYVYTLTATDNVGNTSSVATSPVLVDTTAPSDAFSLNSVSGGVFKSGTTIYYKGNAAGSFKLRDTVTDSASAPASATFGTLTGGSGFGVHNSETINSPAGGPYDSTAITWAGAASGAPTLAAHGTDGAGNNQSDTTFTLTLDNTAPGSGSISVPAYVTSTSVTITSGDYTDGGSGLAAGTNAITRSNGQAPVNGVCLGSGYSGSTVVTSPDTTVANGQCYVYTLTATDNVGNTSTVSTSPVLVDTTAPAYASSALDAAGTHVDLTFTESASGLDAGSTTPTSAFTVTGATVSGVSYTDTTHIRLTLSSRLYGDATPTVAYNPGALTGAQKVKDSAGNLLGSVSAQSITMTAVPSLSQSTVSAAPGSITADGSSTSAITVQLKNAAGTNLATGGGTITLAVGAGSLGGVTNNGNGTYSATLTSATVAQGVTVTGQLDGSGISSSAPVTYAPGAATKVVFGVQPPSSVTAGQTLSPSLTVRVLDANDNLVTSSSDSVTVAIGTNPGSSTLSGTKTRNASNGVATFNDLSLNKAATGYTLTAASGSLTGATSSSYDVTAAAASTIAVNGGDTQTATVDTNVSTAPSVLVTDAYGNPIQGTSVTFAVGSGAGSLTGGSATTNASGVATVGSWKLGTTAGANTLTATSGGLTGSPITFSATGTASAAANIAVNGGNNQSATVDTNLATAPSVLVTDTHGNPVSGVSVTFAVASGGGSGTSLSQNTNASGVATVGSWKLGTTAGANTLTATSGSLAGSPVTFNATGVAGTAGSMAVNVGDNQSATVNTNVATAPSVVVTDTHGNPVSGVSVTFAIGSGGGSLTAGSATTNASGFATVGSWKLGTASGANQLTASSTGLTSVTFNATGTAAAAANIAVNTGDNQSVTVNTNVTAPSVKVTDTYGNAVSGTSVTFAVASGGGSVTGLTPTTNGSGVATVGSWKLGTAMGANTLTATSGALAGSPVTFNATGVADVLDHLILSPASSSVSADVGSQTYTAEGRDQYENSLGDATGSTAFSVTGGSCTGAACTVTTAGAHTVTGTLLGANGTATLTITAGAAANIALQAGNSQSATVNTNVATAPSVLVTDAHGNAVSGASVTFAVASGGGSVTGGSATTNASGIATVGSWKLGTTAGANSLTATSGSLAGSPITFNATGTAGAADSIAVNAGNSQNATVNTNVATAPSVKVTDSFGNAVSGVSVTFAVASGGGSGTGLSQSTNASGVATVGSWKLGTTAGANTLTATSGSLTGSPVTFSATGTNDVAATIAVNSGNSQSATVNNNVATAPSVLVTDQFGNPVAAVSVTFAVASGGGSATGTSANTNASGVAVVGSWKLGTTAGANTLTATSGSLTGSPVTFSATGTAGAATTIAVNGGNSQNATVDTNVSTAPSVLVTDTYGNPVTGIAVTFAASGGGSATGLTPNTNVSGVATVGSWKLGQTAGANTLTATSGSLAGSPVTFNATGVHDTATTIAVNAGNNQTATVNANVATAPSVFVGDEFGNPVSGISVTFAVGSGGGSLTGGSATTNASGVATVGSWKLGTGAGANTLTATSGSLTGSPVTFNATGVNDIATAIAINGGNNQSATVDANVGTAPSAKVTDQYGNPVAGVSVTFAVASGGGSGTGLSQSTNASGVATITSWKLGQTAGANTLSATASVGSVTFNATGTAGAATSIAVSAGDAQVAIVNTNVATAPSAFVTDTFGNPVAGVSVTFAVASGGGSATSLNATTNLSGLATVGSWKLGTATGANTLTATASVGTATFNATAVNDSATTIAVNAGNSQSATVNTNVGTAPSVLVTDQFGNPVAGVSVTFAVASGGGSGTSLSQTTNAGGIATVGSWKLGTTAGANTLTATSGSLGGSPITFSATGTAAAASTIAVNGGDGQSAVVDTNVSATPSLFVSDTYGNPVAGVGVTFAAASGGGSITGGGTTTNASGIATVGSWKLGVTAGANTLTATSGSLTGSPVTFNATGVAGTAGSMTINGGEGQTATVNTNVATSPSVSVTDTHGNPVAGVSVTFSIGSGGGSLTGGSATTNASGVATVGSWKLGTGDGANTLTASASGLSSVTFNATGVAGAAVSIALNGGDNQTATVDTTVSTAPSVRVADAFNNPVAGISVTFAIGSGGGSVTAANATSLANGVATIGSWKLGTAAGAKTLTASSTGLTNSPITFNATAVAGSAGSMAVNDGEGQSATVNATVATAPSVIVTDALGNPVAGVSVNFAVATGAGTVTSANRITGADGIATVGSWQLGTTSGAGGNTLTVTSGGLPNVTFHATGLADTAANLDPNAGDSQSATVDTNVAVAPAVKVTDAYGNPVSGISVVFAVASGGGSATGLSRITGANGIATVGSWKLGQTAGANTLTATSAGLAGNPVTFNATGTPDSATTLAVNGGNNQSATVDTNVATAPSVKATDQFGNGVPGVGVTFAVASGGGSATSLSQTTGVGGVATVGSWQLGQTAGANTLTATSGSLTGSPVTLTATGTAAAAASLAAVSGNGQSATVDTDVSTAPSVRVTDSFGNPVAGISVTFAIGSGGGSLTGGTTTTNASGVAPVGSWTLGTAAGANTLTANSTGLTGSPVTFNATGTAGAAATIAINGGNNQTAAVNNNVATAPSAKVTDAFGNPVPGTSVTFAVASGGGSATGLSQSTNASGIATVGSWKLGTVAGVNTLTATSGSLTGSPLTFSATGSVDGPTSMGINLGDSQSAIVNTGVATAPSVLVADQFGNPVSGVAVTFAVASGGGSVTGSSATTNASGIATVGSWTLGTAVGDNTLTADSSGLTTVTFHAAATVDAPATLTVNGGDNQSTTVNTNVTTAPSVKVADQFGNPVPGVSVDFTVASGGGSRTGGSATTNASGVATVGSWKLGTAVGANTLTASSAGLTDVTLNATATVDAAVNLAINAGNGQSATVDTNVSTAPSAKVTDQFGNPVSGVAVTFAVASGGGSLSGANATTNASGVATVGSWTLATGAGANTLTATSGSLTGSPVTFTATATAGSADSIALNGGNNQSATVNTNVATTPSVKVTDQYGNPVSGVSVTFAIASGGGSATGLVQSTNASGVATVGSWTLGTGAGANTLTATSGSLTGSPVTFTATGTADSAASIAVNAGNNQSATVDTNLGSGVSVKVTDQFGNPVFGVGVTFAVASGGGSATGLVQSTNASGLATVGSWKLGTASGTNTLTATSGSLAGSPVLFNGTGTPGAVDHLILSPATTTITADDSQTYSVEGRDQFDNSAGDVTGATTLSITGGTCLGAVCSTPTVGSHVVTGSFVGALGNATLTVSSGAPTHLAFTAGGTANLSLGATRLFTVAVEDAQNNVVTSDSSTSITFARTAGPGNLSGLGAVTVNAGTASKTLTATTSGSVTLTVTGGTLADATRTFTIDPAPVATIDNAPADPSTSATATFDYSANDSAATFECRLDGATYAPCPGTGSGSKAYTGLASGTHNFDVRAMSATATGPVASTTWMVDTTSPTVSLTLPADGSYVKTATQALAATGVSDTGTGVTAVDFEFSSTPGADCSTGAWTLIDSPTGPYTTTWTTPADGVYALRAVAHDGAGHSTCSLIHVTVDQTAPTATLVAPATDVRGSVTLHATGVADATSGLNSVTFERAPTGTSTWALIGNGVAQGGDGYDAAFDTTGVTDGNYDFRISVTDVAGNSTYRIVGPIRIDNTPPSSTLGAVPAYVHQTITLTSSAVDSGSGVASTGYEISPHGADTWTSIGASFDTTTRPAGSYDIRSVATDTVGNVGHSALATTLIDNDPPTATLDAIARYVRGPLTLGSSTSDAGSGLASVRYELSTHSANAWSTVASPFDTTTKTDGDYDFRVVAIDNAGNRTDSAPQLVTIDNTAPNAQLDDPASSAIKRGTITLGSTVSDVTSGVDTTTYRVAPAGTPEASACDSWGTAAPATFDTTTVADGLYDFRVVAVDNAGNGRCSTINTSVRIDNTAPMTTDNAPAGPRNSDVTVTLSPTDGGSQVSQTYYTVDTGVEQTGTTVVIPAANAGTHTIVYHSTDFAGNVEPTRTTHVTIDTTAPTGGAGNGGNAVHGNYVLTDSPTDTIASVEFQYRTGASGPWTSIGNDSDGSDGWHVTWDTTNVSDDTYHLQMIETDEAGNTTPTALADTVVDNTAPASATVNVSGCGAECSGTSVALSGSADASVSGIGAIDFQVKGSGASGFTTVATQTSGFAFNWDSTTVPDGPADIRVAVTDKAGNGPTYSPVTTITVDNNAPTVALTATSNVSGTNVSLGATGSADIDSVAYAISPTGAGTWTTVGTGSAPAPFTFAWDSSARADGVYDLRVTATDGGGNHGTDVKTTTIDNTAPTGALTQPAPAATVGGPSVALAATAADAGTGVASILYQYRAAGPGAFTDITGTTWDTTGVPSGNYELRAKITDNAGNVATTPIRPISVDSTPPALSVAALGTMLSGTITVDAGVTGATQATLQVAPTGTTSWTTVGSASAAPFQIAFDSSTLTDGTYDVRVVAVDAFGNQASDTKSGVTFDNTAPQLTASTPEDGGVLPNGSTISTLALTATEPLQSVTNVKVDGQPVLAAPVVTGTTVSVSLDAPVADGLHTFTGKLTDLAGKVSSFRINATILAPAGSLTQPPIVSKNARPNNQTLLTSADGSATVFVPAGAYDVPFGHDDDFLVLSMGPQLASIQPMSGMTMAGSPIDVTMDWNSNGEPLHVFRIPLGITLSDPTGGAAIPATYQNGRWHLIPLIQSTVLPAGQDDGFYRDATGVHVLTKHLTLFTLVQDIELPAAPRDFAAVVADDGLTLRWAPGIDQARIQNFVLYVDGQPYRTFGPTEYETKLGAFTADDTRSFSIAEINTSGVSSAPSTPLQAVPAVAGRSVADATATLAARGFTAGRQIPVVSSEPVGTVVGPTAVQLLPAGSIVDLQVSSSTVPRQSQFVVHIAIQKRVRLTNHGIAVRILATAPSKISATLDGLNYRRIQRWSFSATAGASVHTMQLAQKLKPGTYTLYWLGRTADGGTYRTSQKIRVITSAAKAHTANPAQIVLTVSDNTKTSQRAVQSAGQMIEATPEQSFDVASTRDASVVIVDADKYGVKLVRDLRTVFPTTSIVALSKSKLTLTILAGQGAVAVPSSTPAKQIAALVDKLSKR